MLLSSLSLAAFAPLALAAVHDISVGGLKPDGTPNLSYWPNNIKADIGDTLKFTFHVKNHTVTQSNFFSPCAKLRDPFGQFVGFDSGFMPVANESGYLPTFEVRVNDTNPIWAYCKQRNPPKATHCQSGMVFSANAQDYGHTFDAFVGRAKISRAQDADSSTTTSLESEVTETVTVTATETETITVTDNGESSSTYWSDAPASTSAANPATHTIVVGGSAGFVYTPSNITANVGDKVLFQFKQKNHTVTQAAFSDPCRKIGDVTYPPVYGFDSGFMPVVANATEFPTFEITVNDTNPIWGYCRQQAANFSHCGVGMTFSVNANPYSSKSFAAFQQLAVQKNGTGFVNAFGNLTAPPPTASSGYYSSYPTGYASGYGSKNANAQSLDTVSESGDDDTSKKVAKLVSTYAPAALGLLGTVLVLLVSLIGISVVLLRRSKQGNASRPFLPSTSYQTVPLTVPHFMPIKEGAHEYEEPRYSDREGGV